MRILTLHKTLQTYLLRIVSLQIQLVSTLGKIQKPSSLFPMATDGRTSRWAMITIGHQYFHSNTQHHNHT